MRYSYLGITNREIQSGMKRRDNNKIVDHKDCLEIYIHYFDEDEVKRFQLAR